MMDLTDVVHYVFGLLGAILGHVLEFTVAFSAYQAMDALKYGESKTEVRWDFVEYFAGVVVGLWLRAVFLL